MLAASVQWFFMFLFYQDTFFPVRDKATFCACDCAFAQAQCLVYRSS